MKRATAFGLVGVGASLTLQTATATPAHAVGLPGAGLITDAIGGVAGWSFDKMTSGVAGWVLSGVAYFANGVLNFLKTSARPQVDAAWFAGPGSPLATVRNLAVALIGGFLFLGFLQGLARGSSGAMVRRLVGDLPMAVLGMVATVTVVTKLLDLTDALSTAVLSQADGQALHFLSGLGVATMGNHGFAVVVVGLVAILAALVLWVELMVRSALVYLLVAVSPLAFAAMVWPAARGVLRRTAQLLVAVILSKFVIAVALAVGVAALGGPSGTEDAVIAAAPFGATNAGGTAIAPLDDPAAGLGTLLVGGVVLALAAFAPFIVLRLIPVAEAALAAQGVSRGPLRAAQSGVGTYYYANSVTRLGGSKTPSASSAPSLAGGPRPGSTSSTPGGASGAAATGGAAAGGVGAAAAAANTARAAGRKATSTARQTTDAAAPPLPSSSAGHHQRQGERPSQPDDTRRAT